MATPAPNQTPAYAGGASSALATAAFVIGIIAALAAPFLIPGLLLGLIGLGLGLAGRSDVRQTGKTNMWAATAGIVLSSLAILYPVIIFILVALD